jgi:non-specific serine/threonine protein kinase
MTGPPQRIGPYQVGREIGRGGMGVVYLAHDTALDRSVAIKALPEEYLRDEGRLDRFLHEARILAQLRSPHIAAIHHLEDVDGRLYLILEFVEGESLAQRILRGPASVRQALSWARQVALGLEAAHARGIVHRDLKPGNIMISPRDEVKILDFGLAKLVAPPMGARSDAPTQATVAGEALGTPGYMSPEQVRGEEIDHRADIWSFGCVLYECLTGRRAFAARSQYDAVSAVLRDEPDLGALSQAVPQRIRDLLRRCLTKDSARRLRDIGDARLDIEDALAPPATGVPSPPPRTNIPPDLTSFVGRAADMAAVARHLSEHRLVTVHGCGGGGKTRLAIQVARTVMADYPGGAWLIELAGMNDGLLLAPAAASALGMPDGAGDRLAALGEFIESDRTLLVLDNCEHLIDACAAFAGELLRRCPRVSILATSREILRAPGEQCYLIESMEVPPPAARSAAEISARDAPQLFLERARLVRPGFAITDANAGAVAEICRRLEGIPLAIELAAARLRALSPHEILERLRDCFDLLSRAPRARDGAADRHRTLRAAVQWSYDLLNPQEQAMLRRLSVFRGGWTLDAAEEVAGIDNASTVDLLEALVEKSLVLREERDEAPSRYRMLEIIREYADSRMTDAAERDPARRAHHAWCLELAQRADTDLSSGRDQEQWLAMLALEHDNIRAALAGGAGGPEATVALTADLLNFWYLRGYLTEGRRWFAAAMRLVDGVSPRLRARCHVGAGVLAWSQGDYASARAEYEVSLSLWREIGDEERCAGVLTNLGMAIFEANRDCRQARLHLDESRRIYETRGALGRLPMVDLNIAVVCIAEGKVDEAAALLARCGQAFAESGDENRRGFTCYNLARIALRRGQPENAMSLAKEAAAIALRVGIDSLLAPTMALMAEVEHARGHLENAMGLCAAAMRLYERSLVASPERDIQEACAHVTKAARAKLGSATCERIWLCARAAEPSAFIAAIEQERLLPNACELAADL